MALSPRTWGWTFTPTPRDVQGKVVPTHVGVDLLAELRELSTIRCPHARGGGPSTGSFWPLTNTVVPTHVGVDRLPDKHAFAVWKLSPRTWGWTSVTATPSTCTEVVPTHVGVDLRRPRDARICCGCPHARGGGPNLSMRGWRNMSCPHARGGGPPHPQRPRRPVVRCPHARGGGPKRRLLHPATSTVVPTHVGVDRFGPPVFGSQISCPHARGGGPTCL